MDRLENDIDGRHKAFIAAVAAGADEATAQRIAECVAPFWPGVRPLTLTECRGYPPAVAGWRAAWTAAA